jgi:CheY-like chemotaxis protein
MQGCPPCVRFMDSRCPRCGGVAEPAGHEDARAFFQCVPCGRVWATHLSAIMRRGDEEPRSTSRVLIADDSPEMLGLMSAWLEDEGCIVVTAGSGREALDAAAVYYPDVVFLDLVLPPPDGFQVCEALKQRLAPEVVLMTGMPNPDAARRAADLGVVALLMKPFAREAVTGALTTALDRCRRDPLGGLRSHFGAHPRVR